MTIESKIIIRQMSAAARIAILKALADETRLKIAAALLESPHCTEELATRLKRTPATISFHLRKLDDAGLVVKRKNQYYLMYALRPELLETTLAMLISPDAGVNTEEQSRMNQYRQKVVRTFFKNGRLIQMPKQWRKRRIVLDEILPAFEVGRDYDETEVDACIHAFADDHCLIRRMLIDEKLMTRSGRTYRRALEEKKVMADVTKKKEIKREFLDAPKEAGIFRITNTENGKVFLGSSLNLHGPLNKHRFTLSIGSHINKELQKDWKQYGEKAFVFEIVETVQPSDAPDFNVEDELELLEEIWTEKEKIFTDAARSYNRRKKIRE
ncbi:MAG: metalloregulator ArsR/SmtB family transcription factor [Deltaproteobacteria bacterium]|nr:metalloregulator ArsR/SmtB family transcription factor [Deltaproteobacteria bacterium]